MPEEKKEKPKNVTLEVHNLKHKLIGGRFVPAKEKRDEANSR